MKTSIARHRAKLRAEAERFLSQPPKPIDIPVYEMIHDYELSLLLLLGYSPEPPKPSSPDFAYLPKNSADEGEARKALARLLLSEQPLPGAVRWALAALIDPSLGKAERKIEFNFLRGRRKQVNWGSHLAIEVYWELVRQWKGRRNLKSLSEAIENVADRFGLKDDSTVAKNWRQYGAPMLDEAWLKQFSSSRRLQRGCK